MQMGMTQRDKKLLMYLGLVVVIVCFGYWGVRPLVKGIIETDEEIIMAESDKEINMMKSIELPIYRADNNTLEEDIVTARSNFYPMMSADQIDKMVTGKVLEYNLYAYDLSISIPEEEVESEPYIYSEAYNNKQDDMVEEFEGATNTVEEIDQIDEYATGGSDAQNVQLENYETATGIYVARIDMRVGGDAQTLQMLIDDLSTSTEKQLVRAYSWEDNSSIVVNDSGDYEYVSERCLNITLDIYMCEE